MPSYGLKPLNSDPDRKIPAFSVCDIESTKWINFLVIGLAWKKYDEEDQVTEKKYLYFTNMGEFCEYVFTDEHPHETVFAHFGGKFDFSFALKEYFLMSDKYKIGLIIPRGSGMLCFEVSTFTTEDVIPTWCNAEKDVFGKRADGKYLIRDRTITFRDSSAMMPFGLASLTENFGVEHVKMEIDYDAITKVDDELLKYLEYDCWGLYEVIATYFRWPMIKEAGAAMTVASQALRVFRTFMRDEIASLTPNVDEFVRSSYFGGRTEIFKPFFQQVNETSLLKSYDVNSLYPAVMRDFDFPGGFKFETQFYLEHEMGFYDVEVTVPDMYVPPLGVRYEGMENRLIFPIGTFRGVWSTHDLNYAMTVGCTINKVYKGMIFHNIGPIFKHYINHLYDMRKKSEKGSVNDILCKLLMNSSYGRFGLNLTREQLLIDQGQDGLEPVMDIPLNQDGSRIIRISKQIVELENSFSNVAIAAWVTSAARVWMHKLIMEAPEDMYYMDTDSLKTTHDYPRNDSDLGKLKLEYKSKLACYVLPKTYLEDTLSPIFKIFDEKGKTKKMKDAEGNVILDQYGKPRELLSSKKIVMKGFDKRKISKFNDEDFMSALEGDMRRLKTMNPEKFAPLRSAIKKNEFLHLLAESPRQIRTRYNKRRIVKREYAQIWDTEPLHIENGVVTNLDKDILKKWKAPTEEDLCAAERSAFSGQ